VKQILASTYLAMIEGNDPTVLSIKPDYGWTWNYVSTRVGKWRKNALPRPAPNENPATAAGSRVLPDSRPKSN